MSRTVLPAIVVPIVIYISGLCIIFLPDLSLGAGIGTVSGGAPDQPVGGGEIDAIDGVSGFKCTGGFDIYFVLDRLVKS